jgi:hypothetical protein
MSTTPHPSNLRLLSSFDEEVEDRVAAGVQKAQAQSGHFTTLTIIPLKFYG